MTKYYKYRAIKDTLSRDLKSLESNSFYAPTTKELNDPAEGVVNDQFVVDIYKYLDNKLVNSINKVLKMRHNVGVYSLSLNFQDEVMWAHYAESHLGFCIEYDAQRLVLEPRNQWTQLNVEYSETPPDFGIQDISISNEDMILKLIGHKSNRWEYEEETRIVTARAGVNYYAQSAVTGIYFGCRCEPKVINKIRKALTGRSINFYKMNYPELSYELKYEKLPYASDIDGDIKLHNAPIENQAIPEEKSLGEYSYLYSKLLKAVEIVRRDPSCKVIEIVDVSRTGPHKGMIFVHFQSSVKTDLSTGVNWYFNPEEIT